MKTKKSAIIIVVIAVIVLVAGAVFGFTYHKHHSQKQPEDTFNTFIYALNDNNVEDMLECIEPTEAELIRLALDKIDDVTDSKLVATLVKYLPFLADFTEFDILPELYPDIISADTDTKNSTLKIKLDGKEEKLYYNVYMIKLDNKWYIQYAWKA